jgi:hemerythrin superfamily protein
LWGERVACAPCCHDVAERNGTSLASSVTMGTVKSQGEIERSIFHALMRQHRTVEALFDQIRDFGQSEPEQAMALFGTLRQNLLAHAEAEEALVYPRFREISGLSHDVQDAIEEHAKVELALDRLRALDANDPQFRHQIGELEQMVRNHVADEEGEIMRLAKLEIDADESERLADAFLAEYKRRGGQMFELPSSKDAASTSPWRGPV